MSKRKPFDDDMDNEHAAELYGDKNANRDVYTTVILRKDGVELDNTLEEAEEKRIDEEIEKRETAMNFRYEMEDLFFKLQDECRSSGYYWLDQRNSFSAFVDSIAPDPYENMIDIEQQTEDDGDVDGGDINWNIFNKPKTTVSVKHVSLTETEIAKVSVWGKKATSTISLTPTSTISLTPTSTIPLTPTSKPVKSTFILKKKNFIKLNL
jgi:hypothetical protein